MHKGACFSSSRIIKSFDKAGIECVADSLKHSMMTT
jgi:hypothetical protein